MLAILAPDDYDRWFDAETPLKDVHALPKPFPVDRMDVTEANPL